MSLAQQIKPISYLKSHAADIIKNFATNPDPLIITQNGEAKLVVLDEPNSSLDEAGDAALSQAIQTMKSRGTTFGQVGARGFDKDARDGIGIRLDRRRAGNIADSAETHPP